MDGHHRHQQHCRQKQYRKADKNILKTHQGLINQTRSWYREQKLCSEQSNTAVAANIDIFWLYPAVWWMKVIQFVCFMVSCSSSELSWNPPLLYSRSWSHTPIKSTLHSQSYFSGKQIRLYLTKYGKGHWYQKSVYVQVTANNGGVMEGTLERLLSQICHTDREKGRSPSAPSKQL